MFRKIGRLFVIKTRWEAFLIIYALALFFEIFIGSGSGQAAATVRRRRKGTKKRS